MTGPGGIGKTRLAVEVAGALRKEFSGGVHFVPLSALSDPALIAAVIVQTLGVRGAAGSRRLEILKESLRNSSGGPMLLLLDNFEHLLQAAPIVAELLVMGPDSENPGHQPRGAAPLRRARISRAAARAAGSVVRAAG